MQDVFIRTITACLCLCACAVAQADDVQRLIEFQFTATKRTQIALWIEREDGTFLKTIRLTSATAYRGIGNRPGAYQMNSGFRWPYGRREGVLPIWAQHRASASGAQLFRRIVFQERSEGFASRASDTPADYSREDHFCLSFNKSTNLNLDAMTCASVFNSDKGRYLRQDETDYKEPYEVAGDPNQNGYRILDFYSLYPPRRDVTRCTAPGDCYDSADLGDYASHARQVMPDIDAVTMATPAEGTEQRVLFSVPTAWAPGSYVAWLEVALEGDHNTCFSVQKYRTPQNPAEAWDSWAKEYGYAYRGQPSVIFKVPFQLESGQTYQIRDPAGYSSWNFPTTQISLFRALDGCITHDAASNPGSGADRLLLGNRDWRFRLSVKDAVSCNVNQPPPAVGMFTARPYSDEKHAHEWGHLQFKVPMDDSGTIYEYQVRVSTSPIDSEDAFTKAQPANRASLDSEGLVIPATAAPGEIVNADFGGLVPQTRYYIAVRAVDTCNAPGAIATSELVTSAIKFTTVSPWPCFIATAAYGTPLHPRIAILRRFRDQYLMARPWGRTFVSIYVHVSPPIAGFIAEHAFARKITRMVLEPVIDIVNMLL